MPSDTRGGQPHLNPGLDAALRRARSLDDVLTCVVSAFEDRFALCRVSLRVLMPGNADVEVLAVWSRRASGLIPGTRMPLRATTLAEILATGRSQLGSDVQPADGLLLQVLAEEVIRSYASAPLGDVARGDPVLSLSSRRSNGFVDADLPLVEAIAAAVAPHVTRSRGTT